MDGDTQKEAARFASVIATTYDALNEASVGLAVQMRHVPPDPEAIGVVRADLEGMRRLLQQCLLYVETVEHTALGRDEDDLP